MNITDLITKLITIRGEHGDLEVTIMKPHSHELEDDAAVDIARRLPPGVPFEGTHDWQWAKNNPPERFSERVVVVY